MSSASSDNRNAVVMRWLGRAAIAFGLGVMVVLTVEVRNLRPLAKQLKEKNLFPYRSQWVPTVRTASLQGDSVTVGETTPGRTQVLIFFSASCPNCAQVAPTWMRITNELMADSLKRTDVLWVSSSPRDSTQAFLDKHHIAPHVVFPPDQKMLRVYRVKYVPMTVVIDYNGQIRHVLPGIIAKQTSIDSILTAARNYVVPGPTKAAGPVTASRLPEP